jgi:SAM-dependent methyltransferase
MNQRVRGAIDLAPEHGAAALALDLSAGDGQSSELLKARGWRVISTEYHTRKPGWVAADLDHALPFKSARFDLVTMLEVIEHLADIPHAIEEIARVLKPGGVAIITTPNRLSVTSRVHYLLTGYYKGRRSPLPYRYKVGDGRNWHVMGLNDLHWIAWGAGLRLEALGRGPRKLRARILAVPLYPLIAAYSWLSYVQGVNDAEQREINRQLFGFMTSPSLLIDENILMRFRKNGAP